jgi:hypothetical protein
VSSVAAAGVATDAPYSVEVAFTAVVDALVPASTTATATTLSMLTLPTHRVVSTPDGLTATGSSPLTVEGLRRGVQYTFSVVAVNAAGRGAASPSSSVVFLPQQLPDAPSGVVALAGNGVVSVAFDAPLGYGTFDSSSLALPTTSSSRSQVHTYTVTALPGGRRAFAQAGDGRPFPSPVSYVVRVLL